MRSKVPFSVFRGEMSVFILKLYSSIFLRQERERHQSAETPPESLDVQK
jgi:hypothetical protein